jgi:hypothetical protein
MPSAVSTPATDEQVDIFLEELDNYVIEATKQSN